MAVSAAFETAEAVGQVLRGLFAARAVATTARAAEETRVVIGKMRVLESPGAIGAGERTLLPQLEGNLGSEAANWARNERVLLKEMESGNPIRDASVDARTGELIDESGFLGRERNVLRSHGWTYNPKTTLWSPPIT